MIGTKGEKDQTIRIIVATHKPYWMPEDPMYLPVQVGAEGKPDFGYMPDNTGDNISKKNASYCELTGLYWAWKNLDADYLGLVHYRRYFVNPAGTTSDHHEKSRSFLCLTVPEESCEHSPEHTDERESVSTHPSERSCHSTYDSEKNRIEKTGQSILFVENSRNGTEITTPPAKKAARLLTREHAWKLLQETDILLPKKRHYWIETNYSQYIHAHHEIDLETTRQILAERYPEYVAAFDLVMKRTSGHRFNMFLMKRDVLDLYCRWLFDILFELEQRLDIRDYSQNDQRVFGFVAERLLDVWITANQLDYKEVSYIFMEKENWAIKGMNFLLRKLNRKPIGQ